MTNYNASRYSCQLEYRNFDKTDDRLRVRHGLRRGIQRCDIAAQGGFGDFLDILIRSFHAPELDTHGGRQVEQVLFRNCHSRGGTELDRLFRIEIRGGDFFQSGCRFGGERFSIFSHTY